MSSEDEMVANVLVVSAARRVYIDGFVSRMFGPGARKFIRGQVTSLRGRAERLDKGCYRIEPKDRRLDCVVALGAAGKELNEVDKALAGPRYDPVAILAHLANAYGELVCPGFRTLAVAGD